MRNIVILFISIFLFSCSKQDFEQVYEPPIQVEGLKTFQGYKVTGLRFESDANIVGPPNTEVTIISSQGELVLKTNNYQNNWPENEIMFKDINPVYYYIITPQNNKVRKGSITLIK